MVLLPVEPQGTPEMTGVRGPSVELDTSPSGTDGPPSNPIITHLCYLTTSPVDTDRLRSDPTLISPSTGFLDVEFSPGGLFGERAPAGPDVATSHEGVYAPVSYRGSCRREFCLPFSVSCHLTLAPSSPSFGPHPGVSYEPCFLFAPPPTVPSSTSSPVSLRARYPHLLTPRWYLLSPVDTASRGLGPSLLIVQVTYPYGPQWYYFRPRYPSV